MCLKSPCRLLLFVEPKTCNHLKRKCSHQVPSQLAKAPPARGAMMQFWHVHARLRACRRSLSEQQRRSWRRQENEGWWRLWKNRWGRVGGRGRFCSAYRVITSFYSWQRATGLKPRVTGGKAKIRVHQTWQSTAGWGAVNGGTKHHSSGRGGGRIAVNASALPR